MTEQATTGQPAAEHLAETLDGPPAGYRLGVGILLFDASGRVFVAERIDTPGAWQMPQGGIDKGEDPRAAVLRELEEETGTARAEIVAETHGWLTYDLPEDLRGKVWKGRFRGQAQKWYAARFTGGDDDIDLDTHHHPEFATWRWAELESLPDLIVDFKRPLYRAIVAELGPAVQRAVAGAPPLP
ncbi:MAG: RNA pyrophosphohydrolase [Bauldia litoralis]